MMPDSLSETVEKEKVSTMETDTQGELSAEERTYVEMCDRAGELQALRPEPRPDTGRFYFVRHGASLYARVGATFNDEGFAEGGHLAWLPSAEELLAMVLHNYVSPRKLLVHVGEWCADKAGIFPYSVRILLLLFVMEQQYLLHWDAGNWTKSANSLR